MKYCKGLAKKNSKKWTGKEWYHQRFDGSPYFMHFIAEGEIAYHVKRKLGCDFKVHYCFYENGKADWYILMDDIHKVTNTIIKLSKKHKSISKKLINSWKHDEKIFYAECKKIGKINLKKLTDKELIAVHDNFAEITLKKNSSSSIIDGFALGSDKVLARLIQQKIKKEKSSLKFPQVFSILTAPRHFSFINEAEINLLKIACIAKKEHCDKIIRTKGKSAIVDINGTKTKLELQKHQKKYFWIKNNYVSNYMVSVEDFLEELQIILTTHNEPAIEIKRMQNGTPENIKKKNDLIKQLKLDDNILQLITISEDFTYWQDERKKSTLFVTHYFSLILQEIARRVKIDSEDLKYMTCREVSTIFNTKPKISELHARKINGVYYWDKKGIEALHGIDADTIRKEIIGEKATDAINDFRGLTASLGKVIGRVVIVRSATEISKVKKGDILVAVMTRPDYVPAMKIAGAIVTDEGGVTCHAAIVSRELDIPCIIATKIATKVLRDGDMVEVNANHGIVRKIE